MYAIVRAGGRQHKVAVGDVLEIDRIDAKPGDERLARVAAGLRRRTAVPGRGAGSGPDPFRPERREAAKRLARRQS